VVVARELARKPQERLFKVVVGLGGNVVVREVLAAVEVDGLGLHLSVLDVHLVAHQHDRDVVAHTSEIAVPVGHVLVADTRRHVEHDNAALGLDAASRGRGTHTRRGDVSRSAGRGNKLSKLAEGPGRGARCPGAGPDDSLVAITQACVLFLAGRVPHVEDDLAAVCGEIHRMHLCADCGHILLLELAGLQCGAQETHSADAFPNERRASPAQRALAAMRQTLSR